VSNARCQRSRQWISLRLDGSLNELEAVVLAHHLRKCGACARFSENVGASTRLLRAADVLAPRQPIALPAGVARARPPHRRARQAFAFASAGLAAVAAAVALVDTHVVSSGGEPPSVEASSVMPNDSLGVQRLSLRRPISHTNFIRGDVGIPS